MKRAPLLAFFGLTFAISWAAWLPAAARSRGYLGGPDVGSVAGLIGAFGPTLAAVALTGLTAGRRGLRRLLGRLFLWRVNLGWYLFALLWPPALSSVVTAVHVAAGGGSPDFAHPPFLDVYPLPAQLAVVGPWPLIPVVFLQTVLLGSPLGEEVGWRGYALPRLQRRTSPLAASLILGAVWGLWHLPLFVTVGHPISGTFYGWFLVGIMADAVVFTWLYNHTGGSLLLAVLGHASIAVTGLFLVPALATPLLGLAMKLALVGALVVADRRLGS